VLAAPSRCSAFAAVERLVAFMQLADRVRVYLVTRGGVVSSARQRRDLLVIIVPRWA